MSGLGGAPMGSLFNAINPVNLVPTALQPSSINTGINTALDSAAGAASNLWRVGEGNLWYPTSTTNAGTAGGGVAGGGGGGGGGYSLYGPLGASSSSSAAADWDNNPTAGYSYLSSPYHHPGIILTDPQTPSLTLVNTPALTLTLVVTLPSP